MQFIYGFSITIPYSQRGEFLRGEEVHHIITTETRLEPGDEFVWDFGRFAGIASIYGIPRILNWKPRRLLVMIKLVH